MAEGLLKSVTGQLKPVSNTVFDNPKADEGSKKNGKNEGNSGKNIALKEFFWDQFLTYIATGIALLTVLDASIQFFRSSGLQCYVPMDVLPQEFTRDNAAFVNTFCLSSLSWSEYYTVFILIQGIVVVAPHYLWSSVFSGRFDFFVDLVKQIDRLRDSDTGDFRPKNIDIVKKLEQEFPEKWKWTGIFVLYIVKLLAQFLAVVISLLVNIFVFPQESFAFVFSCPRDFNGSTDQVEGWLFPIAVSCSYPSFRVLSRIQIANYVLLVLALGSVVYGILWCFKRHSSSLGYKDVAKFAFSACLAPEEYVCESLLKNPFHPRIRNDLDFLVMILFRADSGHGRVFKDIQVSKEIKNQITDDHVKLHLLNDAIKDNLRNKRTGGMSPRDKDIREIFLKSGFDNYPEVEIHNVILGEERLGNMKFEPVGGLRDRLFGFLQFSPANDMAYDISFGTVGCALILARGFKQVVSVNFHPFYRNVEEVVKKEVFQVNYSSVIVQQDIFAQKTENLRMTDEAIDDELNFRDPETRAVLETKQINFIVVGPFVQEATKGTVNLHIERMNTGRYFSKNCVLLAIRPVKIADKDVSEHFCKYEPAKELFLKKMEIDTKLKDAFPLLDDGLVPVECAGARVECMFEFIGYSYQGQEEPTLRRRPPRQPPHEPPLFARSGEIRSLSHSPRSASNNRPPVLPSLSTASLHDPSRSENDLLQFSPPTPDIKDNRSRVLLSKKTNVEATSNTLAQSTEHFGYPISDLQYLQPLSGSQPTPQFTNSPTNSPPGTPV